MFRKTPLSIAERRSRVRVRITNYAAIFLFGGGTVLIGVMVALEQLDAARQIFTTILPISASIIAYWFGNRSSGGVSTENTDVSQIPTNDNNDRDNPS